MAGFLDRIRYYFLVLMSSVWRLIWHFQMNSLKDIQDI